MSAPGSLKPRPIFRLLFFMVGVYFGWKTYLGITQPGLSDSPQGYFLYLALYPGLALFFCWNMALRGSAGWGFLPRWMMTGGASHADPDEASPLEKDDQWHDDGLSV